MDIAINYWAILACGVSSVVIGFLWFGPVFGNAWMSSMGMTMPSAEERKKMGGKMMKSAFIAFVAALITAYGFIHALTYADAYLSASGVSAGLTGGFWNWLSFMMPVVLGAVLWEGKSWKWWCITAGYYLVNLLVMGAILSSWT